MYTYLHKLFGQDTVSQNDLRYTQRNIDSVEYFVFKGSEPAMGRRGISLHLAEIQFSLMDPQQIAELQSCPCLLVASRWQI